jgi:cytochrome c oxidase subunit 3
MQSNNSGKVKHYPGQQHLFHLVTTSPWPLLTATSALSMLIGVVMYMHSYSNGFMVAFTGFASVVVCMSIWWRDVVREATYRGDHTSVVQVGLRYGMLLFILSEVCFFVAFFWAFFHSSLSPTVEIGSIWPPEGFVTFNPWEVPFLNTAILLSSGAAITAAHHFIVAGDRISAIAALEATLGFAVVFTLLQVMEYLEAPFSISDGIYGSTFFMATGFHGFHVIIGTIMIAVMTLRLCHFHFTKQHHFGFEAAAWYWHFVDVVWLFLFVTIYWWGSLSV